MIPFERGLWGDWKSCCHKEVMMCMCVLKKK